MMTNERLCWACREKYPATSEYFKPAYNTSGGLTGKCRNCRSADRRALRAERKAAAERPPKPTKAEKRKAYYQRKKIEHLRKLIGGEHG